MEKYPYRSQENTKVSDVFIPVKLFELWSTITWRLSEYDPFHKIAFGYVTGYIEDEWWSISLEELESLEMSVEVVNLGKKGTIPRVKLDKFHRPKKFSDLPIKSKYDFH